MTLSALTHRKLAATVPAASTAEGVLNAIYAALFTATDWYDTTTRTSDIMVKNVALFQNGGVTEAVYGEFAGADMANVKWMFFGVDTGSRTPTMRTPDTGTITNGQVHFTLVRNAGAFATWDSASPFTSGQNFGGWKVAVATNVTSVECYESQDTLWVAFNGVAATTVYACGLGGLWDPGTTDLAASELNGRRIGMITGGTTVLAARNGSQCFLAGANGYIGGDTTQVFLDHSSDSGGPHAGVLNIPTLSSINYLLRDSWMRQANDPSGAGGRWAATGSLDDGRIVRRMIGTYVQATFATPGGAEASFSMNELGNLREVSCHPLARSGSVLQDGGTDIAYAIGANHISTGSVILLHY